MSRKGPSRTFVGVDMATGSLPWGGWSLGDPDGET